MTMHETFLVHRGGHWAKWAALIIVASVLAYMLYEPVDGIHNGGTWLGYALGGLGAILIFWLMMLGIRKRSYFRGIGQRPKKRDLTHAEDATTPQVLKGWVSAHVWLGIACLFVGTLHTGFQFGWNLHTLAYGLMVVVILSGLFGIWAYARFPALMTENRRGMTLKGMFQEIAEIDRQAGDIAVKLPDEYVAELKSAQENTRIGGGMLRQLSGHDPKCATAAALARLQEMARSADARHADAATRLLVTMGRRGELVNRARRDIRFKALMDIWLYLHIPLSFGLLAALVAHIIAVFFYW